MSQIKDEAIKKIKDEAAQINTRFTDTMARQICELIKTTEDAREVLKPEKTIAGCKKTFDNYAAAHKHDGQAVITPDKAEELIQDYFGINKESEKGKCDVIDITDLI